MRVVAGKARGVVLNSPPAGVRPTTDRVKESLFAILGPLGGLAVVDLFAGSGALGLEALSRGAREVHLFDQGQRQCQCIRQNLAKVRKSMGDDCGRVEIYNVDALRAPRLLPELSPDLILADPPYSPGPTQKGAQHLLASAEFRLWATRATLVLEQAARLPLAADSEVGWVIDQARRYGETVLYFMHVR